MTPTSAPTSATAAQLQEQARAQAQGQAQAQAKVHTQGQAQASHPAHISAQISALLQSADTLRQQHQWPQAIAAYQAILQAQPAMAALTLAPPTTAQAAQSAQATPPSQPLLAQAAHHLALCHMALDQHSQALQAAQQALALNSVQWQSGLVAAKAQHRMGHGLQALHTLQQLKLRHPQQPLVDLELARRQLHTACHPLASAQAVNHLVNHPSVGSQARQMQLLAQLYDRPAHISSAQLNQALVQHAQKTLAQPAGRANHAPRTNPQNTNPQSTPHKPHTNATSATSHTSPASTRPRIGLISNQLHSSPVYFLAIGALRHMALHADLVVFNRSAKTDWATREFQALATEWHPVAQLNAQSLARTLHQHPVHSLLDLGGWMDPTALQALATQPAEHQYKWVGGQSATTGLQCFTGFVSDQHHTPTGSQAHYTEPLLCVPGGYVSYTPPPYMPAGLATLATPKGGVHVGITANPAKLSAHFLAFVRQHWPAWQALSPAPLQLHLIDKRYQLAPLQQRISSQLAGVPLQFHAPHSHTHYLQALGQLHCVLDTSPYSGGLTTLEAHALGVPVYTRPGGLLFSERHTHAHNQYLGQALGQYLPTVDMPHFSPAHALELDRRDVRHAALQRQNHPALAQHLMGLMGLLERKGLAQPSQLTQPTQRPLHSTHTPPQPQLHRLLC